MSIGRCTACVIAFLNLIWMQHNNACEAVILESSDENLYSIGLSHAQPWASLNAMNDLIDRINTKLLNKKLLSATMYNDGSDMVG
ncbi:unnamed protein product [Toxocara canis]|uniref:DUF4371 domain-containing protein n=1 Tax=Toxocara canis TaxID=6265 RepID=A0A183UJ64_TOXCA|nr:unnamed protein product [Toxocara canis]